MNQAHDIRRRLTAVLCLVVHLTAGLLATAAHNHGCCGGRKHAATATVASASPDTLSATGTAKPRACRHAHCRHAGHKANDTAARQPSKHADGWHANSAADASLATPCLACHFLAGAVDVLPWVPVIGCTAADWHEAMPAAWRERATLASAFLARGPPVDARSASATAFSQTPAFTHSGFLSYVQSSLEPPRSRPPPCVHLCRGRKEGTPSFRPLHGFTLVELLVTIAIIGILLGLLLPNLAAVQTTAKASTALAHIQAFGKGFLDHATVDKEGRLSTGAFDHYRDGDITKVGWVADLVNTKFANPAKSLDPISRGKISEELAFATGGLDGHGKLKEIRWATAVKADGTTVNLADEDDFHGIGYFGTSQTVWDDGYNTNFATTWHFSRGDNNISATSGAGAYAVDASAHDDGGDPEMCPLDGDGPLSTAHLADPTGLTSADKIAIMGPAQVGNHDHDHGEDHGGGSAE